MKKLGIIIPALFLTSLLFGQRAISISKEGEGASILFLPGFTSPGSVWNETIINLDGQFQSHLVSYAGFNGLAPINMPWYDQVKNELIDYINNEEIEQLTIIGHSMGGNLAVDIAIAIPDQISSLILVESIPCMRDLMMPGVPASNFVYESPYNQQMLEMSKEGLRKMANAMAQNMTFDPAGIDSLTQWAIDADRKTYVYGYTDLLRLDQKTILTNLQAKTLILGASFPSREIVEPNYIAQYSNLKNKEIVFADKSKHFIMFDQPEWLYAQINTFLQDDVR